MKKVMIRLVFMDRKGTTGRIYWFCVGLCVRDVFLKLFVGRVAKGLSSHSQMLSPINAVKVNLRTIGKDMGF